MKPENKPTPRGDLADVSATRLDLGNLYPPKPQVHVQIPRGKGKAQQMLLPVHHFSPQGKMPRAMPPRGIPVSLRGFLYLLVPGGERDREGGSVLEAITITSQAANGDIVPVVDVSATVTSPYSRS